MAEYYKHEIAKWNVATDDLTLEQEAAYHRVVGMIRLYERPFRNNLRVLSGMWRCNERKAKRLLDELIQAGKLTIEDGFIIDEKAVDDASTLRRLRVDKASAGRAGGIESGKSRRKSLENNDTCEALASTREEKRREEENASLSSSYAGEPEREVTPPQKPSQTSTLPDDVWQLYDRVLDAVGLSKHKPLPTRWMPPMGVIEVGRFRGLFLSDDEIVEAARLSRSQYAEPPNGPKALERVMANFAAAKSAPPITPQPQRPSQSGAKNDRTRFGETINRLADQLSAGTITLDNSNRDPFAARRG